MVGRTNANANANSKAKDLSMEEEDDRDDVTSLPEHFERQRVVEVGRIKEHGHGHGMTCNCEDSKRRSSGRSKTDMLHADNGTTKDMRCNNRRLVDDNTTTTTTSYSSTNSDVRSSKFTSSLNRTHTKELKTVQTVYIQNYIVVEMKSCDNAGNKTVNRVIISNRKETCSLIMISRVCLCDIRLQLQT